MSISEVMLDTSADTGAADDRRRLRRVISQVLVAAAAFILTAIAWECITTRIHAWTEVPEPFKSKIDLCFTTGDYDTVFVGSSRFFHGIDPAAFDAETARLACPTHSFNLGIDALNFYELQFVVEHVLADPRSHIKTLFIEPSLRVRLAPGLEHSQRALTLHDQTSSTHIFHFILNSNFDLKRKIYWLGEQAAVSIVRLCNVGALTNRYIRPQEPPPDMADLTGPLNNGYDGLDPNIKFGTTMVTAEGIRRMIANQTELEDSGRARSLNDFEIQQLMDLDKLAAGHGAHVILLTAPSAAPDTLEEFRAVDRAAQGKKLSLPLLSFSDPVTYFDLYDPKGFTDPDHISQPVSARWSVHVADAYCAIRKKASAPPHDARGQY